MASRARSELAFVALTLAAGLLPGCASPRPASSSPTTSVSASASRTASMTTPTSARERISLDAGWRFAFGHPHDAAKDYGHATGYFSYLAKAGYADGPAAGDFDDRAWRELD